MVHGAGALDNGLGATLALGWAMVGEAVPAGPAQRRCRAMVGEVVAGLSQLELLHITSSHQRPADRRGASVDRPP